MQIDWNRNWGTLREVVSNFSNAASCTDSEKRKDTPKVLSQLILRVPKAIDIVAFLLGAQENQFHLRHQPKGAALFPVAPCSTTRS